ncbi:MAG: PEGA domain-containing protein [Myxococcales bacterium]|nr:PEGA domain-containing protein [Myxococcales bacterium]
MTLCCLLPAAALVQPAAAEPAPAAQQMGTLRIETPQAGVTVLIDGKPIGRTPLPGPWTLPAGAHQVELRPPSGAPEAHTVNLVAGGTVGVGAPTAPDPAAVAEPEPEPVVAEPVAPAQSGGISRALIGYITAGVGVAAIGAGVYFGLAANSAADDANALEKRASTRAAQQSLVDDADRFAFLSNVSFGVGGVALAAGAALVLFAEDGLLADTGVGIGPGAVTLGGTF